MMAKYDAPPRVTLEVEVEQVEVTIGGLLPSGPPPDPHRKFIPGMRTYTLTEHGATEDRLWRLTEAEAEATRAAFAVKASVIPLPDRQPDVVKLHTP